MSPLVTLLDRALQVVLCEHRHILGQGVYVLPAQNQAYLLPVRGGYTKNRDKHCLSSILCLTFSTCFLLVECRTLEGEPERSA